MATPQDLLTTPRGRVVVAAAVVLVLGVIAIAVVASGDDDDVAPAAAATTDAASPSVTVTSIAGPSTPSTSGAPGEATVPVTPGTATPATGVTPTVATSPPTTGPPPSPSSMVTVPVGTLATVPAVGIDETADFGTGLTLEIAGIEAITGEAQLPGEISGPALRVQLRAINDSSSAVSLSHAQVDLRYGPDETPGLILSGSGSAPFEGDIAAGSSATGTYVFGVPADGRDVITILVTYDVTAPIVVFEGPAPGA